MQSFVRPDGFRTLADVLRRTRLTVSVNTGVMHLAAIAGAPTVAINGPNRNGAGARWGAGHRCRSAGEGCGFLHLGFNFDGNPEDCMERTIRRPGVSRVRGACLQLLRSRRMRPLRQSLAEALMQRMRDVLRGSLGRSLRLAAPEDRLAAAWPVACGAELACARRGGVASTHERTCACELNAEWHDACWEWKCCGRSSTAYAGVPARPGVPVVSGLPLSDGHFSR